MDVEGSNDLGEHTDAIVPAVSNDIVQSPSHLACIDAGSPIIETNPKERIPVCAIELKPVLGMIFDKLEDGLEFYKAYAANSGFKMRKSTQRNIDGVVMTKYCVCSKAGESKPRGKVKKRQRTRILCNANIVFRRNEKGQYVIVDFHEGHTHLLSTPNTMVHLIESRELTLIHKSMIVENSKVNKGPVQSFRMFKEYVKGYQNVGASLEDFKNFWRDVKKFIKGYDAQMMIENFMHKKAMCSSYYFDFDVDDRGRLSRVCWFDPIAIKNYSLFGDMTSFDTTFNMNMYKMIFAPFTGVDHHKKCVSFGAGLIRKETDKDFVWLFQNFLSAMSNKYPVAACFTCGVKILGVTTNDGIPIIDREKDKVYYVNFISDEMKVNCTCKKFERHGILCRHALYLLKEQGLDNVPERRSLSRWSKLATCQPICNNVPHTLIEDCNSLDVRRHKIGTLWSEVFSCVTLAEQKTEYVDELLGILKDFKDKISAQTSTSECSSSSTTGDRLRKKNRELEMLLGTKIPKEVVVLPPIQSKTKGSGKRMMSQKEKATKEQKKAARKCNACGELGFHDSRNCPGRV
ncbi:protein FAR1-RELATED SEQUENCE 1-like [Silene latifolia]|uniref:protein FAR1-RELATED SEQUENCE 1-like n=1 Tax=Silene latifolia TaxID=37657 RepID=UPI003D77A7B5